MTWLELFVCGLACWRLATLLGDDSGPYKLLSRFRAFLRREEKTNKVLKKSDLAAGVQCRRCSSVWFGLLVAPYAYFHDQLWPWLATTGDVALLALALSTASILIERALPA